MRIPILFCLVLMLTPLWAAPAKRVRPVTPHFHVDFDTGYKEGDRFDATGETSVNELAAKAKGKPPYRKLTDIRNRLGKHSGKWTAVVAKGAPFTSRYLRFEVPRGEKLAGRLELFKPPADNAAAGVWVIRFDYARLTAGKGGPELCELQLKTGRGRIIASPAMWYGAFLGNWRKVKSNRPLPLNKVVAIRIELDYTRKEYRLYVNGEKTETVQQRLGGFGGLSLVFTNKSADHDLAFGLDNLRLGRQMTGSPVRIEGIDELELGNLLAAQEYLGENAKDLLFRLTVRNHLSQPAAGTVSGEIFNDSGVVAKLAGQAFTAAAAATLKLEWRTKAPGYGWYGVRFQLESPPDRHRAKTAFCVIRPAVPGRRPDSMFGLCLGGTEEDRLIAQAIGVKWRRGFAAKHLTYPGHVAPKPGKWWSEDDQQKALDSVRHWQKAGVETLGYISYNIPWNTGKDRHGKTHGPHRAPPADLQVHAEMVERLIAPLHEEVRYWELWNEPGGYFWGGTPQQYRDMLRVVWDRIKPQFPEVRLIGGGHYMWISRDWVFAMQNDNAGYVDGMALHPYGRPGLWTPVSPALDAALVRKHARGANGGLWATELGAPPHWIFRGHKAAVQPYLVARAVAPVYLLNRIGAGDTPIRVFWFQSNYNRRGPEDHKSEAEQHNLWNYKRPSPAVAAYAAMTHFLEDGKLQGDLFVTSRRGWALHFLKPDGTSVVAVWPETIWPAVDQRKADLHRSRWSFPKLDFEVCDYFGRPVGTLAGDRLNVVMPTRGVHYFVSRRPSAEVRRAFRQATFKDLPALTVRPQPITTPLARQAILRVKVRNETMQATDVTLTVTPPDSLKLASTKTMLKQLQPGETRFAKFTVAGAEPNTDNRYAVAWSALSAAGEQRGTREVQAAYAVFGTPTIDGQLEDWQDACFVSIRHRGKLADWWKVKPSMTIGKGYRLAAKWDDKFFYAAAEIPDHTTKFSTIKNHALEYRIQGDDCLQLGFNVIDKNPDDLLHGHALYEKSLATDIDYEFRSALKQKPDRTVSELLRLTAPGTEYQHPQSTGKPAPTPIGPITGARSVVRYDEKRRMYVHEIAIPWDELPELQQRLQALNAGESLDVAFGFMVRDAHRWSSPTRWCEEIGDIDFGAYGYDQRVGSPCWTGDYPTRLTALWGFVR